MITWPADMGARAKGVYHIQNNEFHPWDRTKSDKEDRVKTISGDDDAALEKVLGNDKAALFEDIEFMRVPDI